MAIDNTKFDISIILPTRKCIEGLNDAIFSILENADHKNVNFEIIIKVDFDDIETIDYIKNYNNEYQNLTFIINSRKRGWLNMVDYIENMVDISKGDWILNVNDDMIFKTKNWNTILKNHLTKFGVYFPMVNGYRQSFPVYPRKIKELLGHIAPHNQIDTYLYYLALQTKMVYYIDDVVFEHHQDIVLDDTHMGKAENVNYNFGLRDFHSSSGVFINDIIKIKEYLEHEIL